MLILLSLTRDKEPKLKTVNYMKAKFLMHAGGTAFLIELVTHFEEDGIMWNESRLISPPIFDDEFILGDYLHPATMKIELPVYDPLLAKQVYDAPNKQRFSKMMQYLLSLNESPNC